MPDQHDLPEGISAEAFEQMCERFRWAIDTGPSHPEATVEKAVEQIIAPLLADLPRIRAAAVVEERERIRELLPDPEKLRLLAEWFDVEQDAAGRWGAGRDVQEDLRKWADDLGEIVATLDQEDDRG